MSTQLSIHKQSVNFKNPSTNHSEFIDHIRNPEHRRVASKFRMGNHNLKIETGRLTIPKTPEDLRICDHCHQNSVENELHTYYFTVINTMI